MALDANYDPYAAMRRRAQQQATQQNQQSQDALKRRFASLGQGQLNSGAAIRASMMQDQQNQQNLQNATQDIDIAEANEMQRRKEVLEGRQYQTGEREAAQRYGTSERMGGQEFANLQRLGQQEFAGGEAQKARDFQKALADREFDAQAKQNALTNSVSMLQLAESLGLDPANPNTKHFLNQYFANIQHLVPR